ncbi:MAG: hypothetical protein GY792_29040 [Gammaproteobacteria bacterium]|nr:hypothetical protein [Gammaproteobacteria bacterium]
MPTYLRVTVLAVFLYLFLVSISLLGVSFKLLGGDFATQLLATAQNPFLGLFIGILATSIIQSSSTVTSLTVGLAGSGALDLQTAIPIIMGSNVGTTVTNTLVAAGHINRPAEFRRAFSAATLDDVFNVLAILVLFPLQLAFNFLGVGSTFLAQGLVKVGGLELVNPLKSMVDPTVALLVWLSGESGALVIVLAVILLFISLQQIVHNLKLLVIRKVEAFFDGVMFKNAASAMLLGLVCTFLVQSSSITTSLIIPLAGAGFLSLVQVFPYVLGANVGTTATALLAALMTGEEVAVTVAFAHLLFNISGILLIWPVKRIPIGLSCMLAEYTLKSRLVPIAYILVLFFALPLVLIYLMR